MFLAETSRRKENFDPLPLHLASVGGNWEYKCPFAATIVNTFATNGIGPFLLIRKTLLLIGTKSISGIIGKERSALMGRNLVLFFVRFSSYPLFSVLWLET